MDFSEHLDAATRDAAIALDIALKATGASTATKLVECASQTVAAFLARLRAPEALDALGKLLGCRRALLCQVCIDEWGRVLAVLAGDDE